MAEANEIETGVAYDGGSQMVEADDCCCCSCGSLDNTCTACFDVDKTPENITIAFTGIRKCSDSGLWPEFNKSFCLQRGGPCEYYTLVSISGTTYVIYLWLNYSSGRTLLQVAKSGTADFVYLFLGSGTCLTSGSNYYGAGDCGGSLIGYDGSHSLSLPDC